MNISLSSLAATILLANATLISAENSDDTIFISAKAPIVAQEFSGSVSVVTAQQIKASGASNVAEALAGLPGVSVGAGGGTAGEEIRIRGMAAEYSLILVDGKRFPNAERNISGSPVNRTNWVAIANIERIELIRGAASSLYGADALSGVINIITKKATDEWRSSVTVTTNNTIGEGGVGKGINISTGGKIGSAVDLMLNVDRQLNSEIVGSNGTYQHPDTAVTNAQLKLGIELNDTDRLQFSYIAGREAVQNAGLSRGSAVTDNLAQDKSLFSADYLSTIGNFNSAVSVSTAATKIDDSGDEWNIKDSTIAWAVDGALGENQYINIGIDHRVEKADRMSQVFKDTFKSTALYAQDVVDINQNNAVTFGLSYENHNKYGSAFSPKIYWNSTVNDHWSVKVGYSEGRISPAIREGSSAYIVSGGPGRVYQGNDDLNPEENKSVELSLSYTGESVQSSVTLFNSRVINMITTADGGIDGSGNQINLYSNVNKARVKGLESSVDWQLQAGSLLSFNYTYTDAVDHSTGSTEGNQIAKRAKHVANLKFTQHIVSVDTDVSFSIKGVSSQFTTNANTDEIEGHGIVNIGFNKSISSNIDISASVQNLTNRTVLDGNDALYSGREFRLALTGSF